MPDFLTDPTPHDEAIDFIKSKSPVTKEVFEGMLPELRARAITVSGITSFDTLQRIRDEISTVHSGANWDDVKKKLIEEIHPFLANPEDPENTTAANRRAETLLRTHGYQASAAASFRNIDAQKEIFPFVEYHSMDDDRVRATHAALDEKVFPFNSPFVQSHWCPWDYGCRCHWIPISAEDAQDRRAEDAKLPPQEHAVVEGHALDHLETTGHLVSGNGHVDLRTPAEKNGPTAYSFNPQDLHIPIAKLQGRYDTDIWATFEKWSRKNLIGEAGSLSVWDWMSGKALPEPSPVPQLDKIQSVAELTPLFTDVLKTTSDRIERKEKFHELLSLPSSEQSSVDHSAGTNRDNLDKGFAFVRSITTSGVLAGDKVKILRTRDRACADPFGKYINGKHMAPWTVAHELGHIIEARATEILRKSEKFLNSRTKGEVPRWLGAGYKHKEISLFDEWESKGGRNYTGKVYRTSRGTYATEILSMGIERLYNNPAGFFIDDPEYFTYVVDTLRGL